MAETDADANALVAYTQTPSGTGSLVGRYRVGPGATDAPLYDGLGSMDRITDPAQAQSGRSAYDAYGDPLVRGDPTLQYVAQLGYYYEAEPALYYVRPGWYDPSVKLWISPNGGAGTYVYSNDNPVMESGPASPCPTPTPSPTPTPTTTSPSQNCGPDITVWLNNEIAIYTAFATALNPQITRWAAAESPWYQPDFILAKSYAYTFAALVGRRMNYFPTTTFSSGACPTLPQCANSVTLAGTCVHTTAVGNITFGVYARFLKLTYSQVFAGAIAANLALGAGAVPTAANREAVSVGYDFATAPGFLGPYLLSIPARLAKIGGNAPAGCAPCATAVNGAKNHVVLPPVTPNLNKGPFTTTIAKTVT